jgi:hypothetical protein
LNTNSRSDPVVESVLNIQWPLPIWLTVMLLLAAGFFCWSVYRRERSSAGRPARMLLAGLRFSLIGLVLWMLAGWSWQRYESERPELAIVVDTSQSMATRDANVQRDGSRVDTEAPSDDRSTNSDSNSQSSRLSRIERALALFDGLDNRQRRQLTSDYSLRWYTSGERLQAREFDLTGQSPIFPELEPEETQSRLGDSLLRLIERQAGRGTAGVVFLSDGINTAGASLADAAQRSRRAAIPIHTVALGQRFVQPDLRLVDLLVDRDVYLGDRVTAEATVVASDIPASRTQVVLTDLDTGEQLDQTQVELSQSNHQQQVRLSFIPDRSGEISLELRVEKLEREVDTSNNRVQFSVRVQDKAIRVLLVYQTPSYEFRFLKNLLQRTRQQGARETASFELISVLQEADADYVDQDASARRLVPSESEELSDVDVFVFGPFDPGLVSRSAQAAIRQAVVREGAGCLFIAGPPANAGFSSLRGRPLETLLPAELAPLGSAARAEVSGPIAWTPTQLGMTALPMQLAASPPQSLELWRRLPPVSRVSGLGELKPGAQVLARGEATEAGDSPPILVAQFAGAGRTAIQTSDETYRWTSYLGSDLYYQRYWGQLLRWLSRGKLSGGAEESELVVDPKQPKLGQDVRFRVRLGATSDLEHTGETVEVALESEEDSQRIELRRTAPGQPTFEQATNQLRPGQYRAILRDPVEADPPTANFVVTAPPGEQANLQSDWDAMQQLATTSRGKYYRDSDAEQLFDNLPLGKKTRLGSLPPKPLWNSWWIALLFVVLITCEWLLRRRARML